MSTELAEDIPLFDNDGDGTRCGSLSVSRFFGGSTMGALVQLTFNGHREGWGEGKPSGEHGWIVLNGKSANRLLKALNDYITSLPFESLQEDSEDLAVRRAEG